MNIQPLSQNNFKGYDARALKGFYMNANPYGIAQEIHEIGKKEGFKIFSSYHDKGFRFKCSEISPLYQDSTVNIWAQDMWMIVKNKLFFADNDNITDSIKDFFNLKDDFTQKIARNNPQTISLRNDLIMFFTGKRVVNQPETVNKKLEAIEKHRHKYHIQGGNIFLIKGNNGEEIIVGKNELNNYDPDEIMGMYGANKLTILPQMDFHLDLFIRPLDNKRILIADDEKTLEVLNIGLKKLLNFMNTKSKEEKVYYPIVENFRSAISKFRSQIEENHQPQTDEIAGILENSGYEIIRVPGRLYDIIETTDEQILKHSCNYINANVLKNKTGDLVYITNKSTIDGSLNLTPEISDLIDFSFEKAFIESISSYVKKEHIYFVEGENNFVGNSMLPIYQGGIHCICMEIPEQDYDSYQENK